MRAFQRRTGRDGKQSGAERVRGSRIALLRVVRNVHRTHQAEQRNEGRRSWHFAEMGRLVADAGKRDWDELTAEYGAQPMEDLGMRSLEQSEGMGTGSRHVNARRVQHLRTAASLAVMGFLKSRLSCDDTPQAKRSKQELMGLIEDYRQGMLPLIVPLTLLKHHLNRYPVPE